MSGGSGLMVARAFAPERSLKRPGGQRASQQNTPERHFSNLEHAHRERERERGAKFGCSPICTGRPLLLSCSPPRALNLPLKLSPDNGQILQPTESIDHSVHLTQLDWNRGASCALSLLTWRRNSQPESRRAKGRRVV